MAVATLDKKAANKGKGAAASTNGTEQKRKGRAAVPENETKEQKFKRLAEKRYKVIVKAIKGFGNLGNKNAYGYNDLQIEKIFAGIEGAVRDTKAKFSKAEEKKDFHIEL